MLLFFSVARSASLGQVERAVEAAEAPITVPGTPIAGAEVLPTDKLVDISPLALRMSSPFNAGYWLSAA
ncbi:MAG: hypothetical protein K2Y10_06765 [Burkholderiaceae bacterium]|nr:hypothetical protein [Burkholderiaceae bacterium]